MQGDLHVRILWGVLRNSTRPKGKVNLDLLQLKWFEPQRHVMLKNEACPDDPKFREYFVSLKADRWKYRSWSAINSFDVSLLKSQKHTCPICGDDIVNGEDIHKHHIIPIDEGGQNKISNIILLHKPCHYSIHHGVNEDLWRERFLKMKGGAKKERDQASLSEKISEPNNTIIEGDKIW